VNNIAHWAVVYLTVLYSIIVVAHNIFRKVCNMI